MKILANVEIVDLSLFVYKRILVMGDFHLGYEQAMHEKGVLVPKFQLRDTVDRLENIFAKTGDVEIIVLNGDLKHEFGKITSQEWSDITKLIDFLRKRCKRLCIIKGNHDAIIKPIADKREIELVDEYREPGLLIIHGNKVPDKLEKIIITGHDHPAVSLRHEGRSEKYKCFLKGKYKRNVLIIMPSFNLMTEGSDITKEKLLSPLVRDVSDFEVFVVGDKIYEFGKVKKLR